MIPLFVMLAAILVARGVGAIGWQPLDDWQVATRLGLAVMFAFTAAAHFNSMRADLIRMVPPRLPYPAALVTLTGFAELAGAVGLLVPGVARWAASPPTFTRRATASRFGADRQHRSSRACRSSSCGLDFCGGPRDSDPGMSLLPRDHRRKGEQSVTVLNTIGRTRLIPLQQIVPEGSARILLKLEYENPTGSMKDRMALAMVEAAEADGRLRPGGSVVEYTGGSTGVSLAFVCAVKRIPLQIVTSDAFSKEKRDHMTALGARLTLVASPTGGTTKALILEMIETARKLASAPGSYWTDQLNNTDQLSSYERMAEEVWEQTNGQVSAFVQSVGTAGSLRGISTRLRAHNEAVHIVAVEPEESAVLSGRPSGSHKIEGIGAGFIVPLWTETLAHEIQTISTQEAMATARRLARHEGIFAGTSTGGNVAVALRVAERLGPDQTVVTLAVDSGMKYLSTALYAHT